MTKKEKSEAEKKAVRLLIENLEAINFIQANYPSLLYKIN
jgi:hypothetical protein